MRRWFGLVIVPVLACGSSSPPPTSPGTSAPTTTSTTASRPQLSGTLVGHDGNPMKLAHVSIGDRHVQVGADGSYAFDSVRPGFAAVMFTGVDHGDYTAGVLVGRDPIVVNVKLGTYDRPTPYAAPVVVQVTFNPDGTLGLGQEVPMTRRDDGTFAANVTAPPGEFAYELRGVVTEAGRSMNGTDATEYRYDGDGNYANVVTATDAPVTVTFDPRAVLPSAVATTMAFGRAGTTAERVATVYAAMAERNAARRAAIAGDRGKDPSTVGDTAWKAPHRAQIDAESDPAVRDAMVVAYFAWGAKGDDPDDAALAKRALADVPAASPMWAMDPSAIISMTNAAGDPVAGREYIDAVVDGISDPAEGGSMLFGLMWQARADGRHDDVIHYYELLHSRFPSSPYIRPSALFDPSKLVRPGAPAPDFDLSSFDDETVRFTRDTFEGKVVLVEFWAPWCKPCVAEMPNLTAMYEQHGEQGFTILSICADDSPAAVRKFRSKKFAMPWPNVVLQGDEAKAVKAAFEVAVLPTQILVGPDGVVIASGPELRDAGLERVLKRALGTASKR